MTIQNLQTLLNKTYMRHQFVYTQKDPIPGKEGEFRRFHASFNIEKCIRSMSLDDGRLLVLLDDIHQRPQSVEVLNKQGKVTAIKRELQTFQSEIFISEPSDIERFYKLLGIEGSTEPKYDPKLTDKA